jgi:hypothetical protein
MLVYYCHLLLVFIDPNYFENCKDRAVPVGSEVLEAGERSGWCVLVCVVRVIGASDFSPCLAV